MKVFKDKRPNIDTYFMRIAEEVSTRGTCDRKRVGAVIAKGNQLLSTGYNGSIPGTPHCDDPELFVECSVTGLKVELTQKEWDNIAPGADYSSNLESNKAGGILYNYGRTIRGIGHQAYLKQGGHLMIDGHCVRTIHAEINAIIQAAKLGVSINGATIYCNTFPCWNCFKTIVTTGIKRIVYSDLYRGENYDLIVDTASEIGVELVHHTE